MLKKNNFHNRPVLIRKIFNQLRRGAYFYLLLAVLASQIFPNAAFAQTSEVSSTSSASGTFTRDELAAQIQEKAKQLEDIDKQLTESKQNLKGVQERRISLQRELSVLQGNISQLDLSIKSDQINVQKLGLEVESLKYDVQDIEASVEDKRSAVQNILLELEKNDHLNANLLMIFLRGNSLADSVLEAQNLSNLQNQLTVDIANLRDLHDEYNGKIQDISGKKDSIAFHQRNLENKKQIVQDQKSERQTLLVTTKNKESVFEKQVADLEKLQERVANEVESLDAVLRTKIDPSILPPLGHGVLQVPIEGGLAGITQGYGATNFAKNGYRGHWHNGVDFGAPLGTPVLAAEDGTIAAVGNQDEFCYKGAYGKFIVIQHKDNLATLYGHLSKQIVKKGDTIKRGEVIGYSGKTGYATGPHLHFTVFAGPTFYMGPSRVCGQMPYGGDLNPIGYL